MCSIRVREVVIYIEGCYRNSFDLSTPQTKYIKPDYSVRLLLNVESSVFLFHFSVEKMVAVGNDILQKQNADLSDVRYEHCVLSFLAVLSFSCI